MRLLLIAAIIAGITWVLFRNAQDRRQSWLKRLALPGRWDGEQDGVRYHLELDGDLDGGSFRERNESESGSREERGRWRLVGHEIQFETDDGQRSSCELRLFESGRIGLHGPGRERRIYLRAGDNVVRLPRRRGSD